MLPALLTSACVLNNSPILNPKGPIALAERNLLLTAAALMLVVVIPVFVMVFYFAWRYRAGGGRGRYTPDWNYSAKLEVVLWLVPTAMIAILGYLLWTYTYKLDPYLKLAGRQQPALEVQVIAQDWKWLFIYPEYDIASVNYLAFPSDRALSLKITSDTVMNSFMIPALGGQIYAMAGMTTQLNLIADAPGEFAGRNVLYSGDGFSDQHFVATALSGSDFTAWVSGVRQGPKFLDAATYRKLAEPSVAHGVEFFSRVEAELFAHILGKYAKHQRRDQSKE